MSENRTLTININNENQRQSALDNSSSINNIKNTINELPLKSMAVGAVAKKTITGLTQRVGFYTGNQELQRNINNTMNVATGVLSIGLAFAVNPAVGVGMVAMQAVTSAFEISDYNIKRKRENKDIDEYKSLSNTNLNNNRYNGGKR